MKNQKVEGFESPAGANKDASEWGEFMFNGNFCRIRSFSAKLAAICICVAAFGSFGLTARAEEILDETMVFYPEIACGPIYVSQTEWFSLWQSERTLVPLQGPFGLPTEIPTPLPTPKPTEPTITPTPTSLPTFTVYPTLTPALTPTPTPQSDTYLIELARFGISNTKTDSVNSTRGINDALRWAVTEGFREAKLPAGDYLIDAAETSRFNTPNKGIQVPSNLVFNLNGAHLYIEPNSSESYNAIAVSFAQNVTVTNGYIHGDRSSHVINDGKTHEFGYGVVVSASTDVNITNLSIDACMGDGIILTCFDTSKSPGIVQNNRVYVSNNTISNCRRQGISLVSGNNCDIFSNIIFDISGTRPECGIDIEPELDYGFTVNGCKIYGNNIKTTASAAISGNCGSGYEIFSNTVNGANIDAVKCSNVRIYDNICLNGAQVVVYPSATNIVLTRP